MFEIDLRVSDPSLRSMHLFVNGTQVPQYITNLGSTLLLAFTFYEPGGAIEYISYSQSSKPKHKTISGESFVSYS